MNNMSNKPWKVYQQFVKGDVIAPPQDLLQSTSPDLGTIGSPRRLYTSPEVHDLEISRMWAKVWQFACREEEIAEPGDIHVYDVGDISVLVVRTENDEIRAYYNSCTHRGTQLCSADASQKQIRCPYHGFTWNLEGALTDIPCQWDFPQVQGSSHNLKGVRSSTWGGFVFINLDPDAEPLESYLEVIPEHLRRSRFEDMYIAGKYRKILPANWKASLEAFVESLHVAETHGQLSEFTDDVNTKYDLYGKNVSRFITVFGAASAALDKEYSEQEMLDSFFENLASDDAAPKLPEGMTARAFMVSRARENVAELVGREEVISDTELVDAIQYSVFPNIILFRSVGFPVVYRFLPNGNDPDSTIFDFYIMKYVPDGTERLRPAEVIDMGDSSFIDLPELPDWLGLVYDQDVSNLRLQQKGLKVPFQGDVTLARYQENRIRHYHQTLQGYLANPE